VADKLANEGRIAGEEMKLPDITSIQFHLGCEAGIIKSLSSKYPAPSSQAGTFALLSI
jgi:hypothetical protein